MNNFSNDKIIIIALTIKRKKKEKKIRITTEKKKIIEVFKNAKLTLTSASYWNLRASGPRCLILPNEHSHFLKYSSSIPKIAHIPHIIALEYQT